MNWNLKADGFCWEELEPQTATSNASITRRSCTVDKYNGIENELMEAVAMVESKSPSR